MFRTGFRVGLASLLMGGLATLAQAQGPFNPYAAIGQGGGAPGAGGLAAYQQSIANPGFNPYTPLNSGVGSNPYTAGAMGGLGGLGGVPYSPYNSPYFGNGGLFGTNGGTLYGAAKFLEAEATGILSQEQARVLRQQAQQARLQTIKQRFDLELYIRANTPTFTELQAKNARHILNRIQNAANPTEVSTGKALNVLLDDLSRSPGKKVGLDVPLSEGVLGRINVRQPKSAGSLGALRPDSKLNWPVALQTMLDEQRRKSLETQAQALLRGAATGNLDANILKDFNGELEQASAELNRKINDLPATQYLEAKHFLGDLHNAQTAIQGGQVPIQMEFQKFIGNGKNVQDVVDYMVKNGLVFAPATQSDEAAYRALYSALVAHDVAFNTGVTTTAPENKE